MALLTDSFDVGAHWMAHLIIINACCRSVLQEPEDGLCSSTSF